MQLLSHFFLVVLALATLISGLGYDPLTAFIPGGGQYILPSVLVGVLLFMVVRRCQHLEGQITAAVARLETLEGQRRVTSTRLQSVTAEAAQLAAQMTVLRRMTAQQELLLPARLLLAQGCCEEAVNLLQEAVTSQPESVEATWLLGEALFRRKRYAEALPHMIVGLDTSDDRRLALVAQCEQALGRYAEAETHLEQLITLRGEPRQDDLMALGMVQAELDPERAQKTLRQALALNPYNSVTRYQLIELDIRTGSYAQAIELATEGLQRNPADVGCFVSRAEAYFRRGHTEDEKHILDDLATAQVRNQKDYNIYRLRGALHQRRASRMRHAAESQQGLHEALDAYEDGLANVPPKFHAHLLAAESRVLLQLKRFDEAARRAQRAVNHYPRHVSNHLALAFAQLAIKQWEAAAETADRGMQWAGWGGRVWLTAIGIFADACGGAKPSDTRQRCAALATDLKGDTRRFALSESWQVVRDVLCEFADRNTGPGGALVMDTIALLEQTMTSGQYMGRWVDGKRMEARRATSPAAEA